MLFQGAGPGVEHGEDAEFAADELPVAAEFQERLGRGLHEDGVELLLVAANDVSQLRRQREDEVEVAGGQKLRFPFLKPPPGVVAVALGTASVLAGMVRVLLMAANNAFVQMSAHAFCAAGENVGKSPLVARQHSVAEFIQILFPVSGYDIGKLDHGERLAIRWLMALLKMSVILSVRWV